MDELEELEAIGLAGGWVTIRGEVRFSLGPDKLTQVARDNKPVLYAFLASRITLTVTAAGELVQDRFDEGCHPRDDDVSRIRCAVAALKSFQEGTA